jgi:hypothetical protein
MKKLLSFLLVLTIVVGAVVAQGLGLTAGVELGFDGLNARRGEFESAFFNSRLYNGMGSSYGDGTEFPFGMNVTATNGGLQGNGNPTLEGVYEITEPYLMPFVYFDKAFFNGGLDVYAEVDVKFGLYNDGFDATVDPYASDYYFVDSHRARNMDLLFYLSASNNLRISSSSTLSFLLSTENNFHLSPSVEYLLEDLDADGNQQFDGNGNVLLKETEFGGRVKGIVTPGIKFKQGFGFGDLYFVADLPVSYTSSTDAYDPNLIYLGFSVGWDSNFGLGVKIRELNLLAALSPDSNKFEAIRGVQGFGLTVSYTINPVLASLEVRIPRRLTFDSVGLFGGTIPMAFSSPGSTDAPYIAYDESAVGLRQQGFPGITVIPRVEVGVFRGLQVYAEFIFAGLGAGWSEDDVNSAIPIPLKHSQSYGIKYSF